MSHGKNKYQKSITKTRSGYFRLPNHIFCRGLSASAIALLGYLISCKENYHPTEGQIRKALKITKKRITKLLEELQRGKLLIFEKGIGFRGQTIFTIFPINDWVQLSPSSGVKNNPDQGSNVAHLQEEQEDPKTDSKTINDSEGSNISLLDEGPTIEEFALAVESGRIHLETPEQIEERKHQEICKALSNPLFIEAFGNQESVRNVLTRAACGPQREVKQS
jgi:hypothetical protein